MGEASGGLLLIWLVILAIIGFTKPEVMQGIWVVVVVLMAISAVVSPFFY